MMLRVNYYLQNRDQRVVLHGQTSGWRKINSGVPVGLVLGLFLFLNYISDLLDRKISMFKFLLMMLLFFKKS